MKPGVIREMTTDEVEDKLNEEFESYRKMRLSHSVSPLENPLQLRTKRRIIARLKTELAQRANQELANN